MTKELEHKFDEYGNHWLEKGELKSRVVSYKGIAKLKIRDTWYLGFTDYYGEGVLDTANCLDEIIRRI